MARLEIPSIVVHKGTSQSRPESPTSSSGGMPALPSSRHALLAGGSIGSYSETTENTEMIEAANVNVASTIPAAASANNPSHPNTSSATVLPPSPPDKPSSEIDTKNFRNRTNTKVKLLVRSHAMRESTSPPREPHNNNGGSPMSPRSPQPIDAGEKKFSNLSSGGLSPNSAPVTSPKINNNESMYNSNLGNAQSPKQTRNSATSPTCRTPSRNGHSSPSQAQSPKNVNSPSNNPTTTNNKNDTNGVSSRGKVCVTPTVANGPPQSTNAIVSKCNNCVKNNHNERPGLLQTPPSPAKLGQALQHSPKNTNLSQNCQQNKTCESRKLNSLNVCNNQCSAQCGNTLSVSRPGSRHKLRHQNSSQGSLDSGASPCLSRDSSTEFYTDSTGIDLEQFIAVTINRNQKDRTVLLRIEKDLIEFAKDRQKNCHKFPNMSSYNRMLVHRVAAYFGMEHNVDQSGLSVVVTRTKNMRIPDTRFKEHIRDDLILTEEPRRSILKRDSSSFEDSFHFKSPDRLSGEYCRRSKSFEEREEEYERARRRIFKDSSGEGSEVTSWPYWSSSESSDTSARYRLLHPTDHSIRPMRLAKGESFDGRDSYRTGVLRPSVSKSFSFGGYTRGMLSRGDSVMSTHSAGARLTKQDSGASMCSRLSPSSSGYKSQSQRSDATISPSPSPSPVPCAIHAQSSQNSGASPEPRASGGGGGQTVMWAVTSISSVPAGSIIMNPQTNQPYTNSDGTIYRFDPENPPKIFAEMHEEVVESIAEVETEAEVVGSPPQAQMDKREEREQENLRNKVKCETKRQRCQAKNNVANSYVANVGISVQNSVKNSATSPTMPFAPSPPIQAQPQPQQSCQRQNQQQTQPQASQDCGESLLKTVTTQAASATSSCPHSQTAQPSYLGYTHHPGAAETVYGQPLVYGPAGAVQPVQSGALLVSRHPADVAASQQQNNPPPEMVFGQAPHYGNYSMAMQQSAAVQSSDVSDLTGYFMGMNVYEQPRNNGDTQSTPTHNPYSQPPPSAGTMVSASQQAPQVGAGQNLQSIQSMQGTYWQPPPNHQMPPQQTMYFVPPSGTPLGVGQVPNERHQIQQQQQQQQQPQQQQQQQQQQQHRFTSSFTFNPQTMTPPSQSTPSYVNNYAVPYNSVPGVAATAGTEFAYQPPVHMIPTYYPSAQAGIQPPPVMWRVPTPPNTPTSNQVGLQIPAGVPLMYVNSGSYPTQPAMLSNGTFGHHHHHHHHQVAATPNGASPAPPGAFMAPAFVPNIVFRQNVPVVPAGIRASTPAGSQRASRSPTPGHEMFAPAGSVAPAGNGTGDNRNAQPQQRYPLPMYQGLHIVQGDMRLMHPGVPGNPRLQYAPVPSPPVVQGCPRPFRPPSYSSNTSGCPTPNSFDGRNNKIRKPRSKVTTLPPSGPRPNIYQVSSMPSYPNNPPKDIREGTVKVTITRRNQLVQY